MGVTGVWACSIVKEDFSEEVTLEHWRKCLGPEACVSRLLTGSECGWNTCKIEQVSKGRN